MTDNFRVLCELWEESLEHVKDTEMKPRIQGVAAQMKAFDFLICNNSDNLSRTIQSADMSAAELRSGSGSYYPLNSSFIEEWLEFWQRVRDSSEALDVEKLALPRRHKLPRRLDDGSAPTFPVSVEEHYPVIYFEALDYILCKGPLQPAWIQNIIWESTGFSQTFKPNGVVSIADILFFFQGCTPGLAPDRSYVSGI